MGHNYWNNKNRHYWDVSQFGSNNISNSRVQPQQKRRGILNSISSHMLSAFANIRSDLSNTNNRVTQKRGLDAFPSRNSQNKEGGSIHNRLGSRECNRWRESQMRGLMTYPMRWGDYPVRWDIWRLNGHSRWFWEWRWNNRIQHQIWGDLSRYDTTERHDWRASESYIKAKKIENRNKTIKRIIIESIGIIWTICLVKKIIKNRRKK